jgi:hypothetical protein
MAFALNVFVVVMSAPLAKYRRWTSRTTSGRVRIQQVRVPGHVVRVVAQRVVAVVRGGEPGVLEHRAPGTVEDDDALAEQLLQGLDPVGAAVGRTIHSTVSFCVTGALGARFGERGGPWWLQPVAAPLGRGESVTDRKLSGAPPDSRTPAFGLRRLLTCGVCDRPEIPQDFFWRPCRSGVPTFDVRVESPETSDTSDEENRHDDRPDPTAGHRREWIGLAVLALPRS